MEADCYLSPPSDGFISSSSIDGPEYQQPDPDKRKKNQNQNQFEIKQKRENEGNNKLTSKAVEKSSNKKGKQNSQQWRSELEKWMEDFNDHGCDYENMGSSAAPWQLYLDETDSDSNERNESDSDYKNTDFYRTLQRNEKKDAMDKRLLKFLYEYSIQEYIYLFIKLQDEMPNLSFNLLYKMKDCERKNFF